MSAIEASSVRVSTMADGTLRIVCDIEPRHAQAAFALFGAPGTALAIAALVPEHARQAEPEPAPEPEQTRGGPLARWVAIRCGEPEFQRWLRTITPADAVDVVGDREEAAARVRWICSIKTRSEIDNDIEAERRFHKRIREPWAAYQQSRGEA